MSWRTPYDPEKATNEYSKTNKMCPDIEGFIMNPKPTRVKKRLLNLALLKEKKSLKDLVEGKYAQMVFFKSLCSLCRKHNEINVKAF